MKHEGLAHFYILFSCKLNKYYVGVTTTTFEDRLRRHNEHAYGSHFTALSSDWELKCALTCNSLAEACRIARFVKRMKSRKFIEKLISIESELTLLRKVNSI